MGGSAVKGVVLCGGQGKRLRPLTFYFQKSMIPIGSKQKPLLEYIVRLMAHHGIRDLVFLVDYKGEQVVNYFDDGSRFGVSIQYVWDDPKYPGNAGALLNAYLKGAFKGAEDLLIYYGDILSNLNLSDLVERHRASGAEATIALSQSYMVSVGVAEVRGGRVVRLQEKPPLGKPVVIGILALKTRCVEMVSEIAEKKGKADIMGDLIPLMLERGLRVEAYVTDAFWYDVGSIERYEKLDPKLVDEITAFLFSK